MKHVTTYQKTNQSMKHTAGKKIRTHTGKAGKQSDILRSSGKGTESVGITKLPNLAVMQ